MKGLVESLQDAIDYMEAHLDGEMDIQTIASKALMSQFYFQRIFGVLCGMTVGEYVRSRRLSLAAQELAATDAKVIDVAVKYGYDSPDSFSRAFQKFHGITPSQAREKGARLASFAPVHIKLTLEGGTMTEYRIVKKAPFTLVGVSRLYTADNCYCEIPKFWDEWIQQGEARSVKGMVGFCEDLDGKKVKYWIADIYCPFVEIPESAEVREIPGGLWAVFPVRGAIPDALQEVNKRIWSEWLPSLREYALAGNYNIEAYFPKPENGEEAYNEIWVPITKA